MIRVELKKSCNKKGLRHKYGPWAHQCHDHEYRVCAVCRSWQERIEKKCVGPTVIKKTIATCTACGGNLRANNVYQCDDCEAYLCKGDKESHTLAVCKWFQSIFKVYSNGRSI